MHRGRRQHARWPVDHRAARRALITHAPPTSSRFAVGLRATRRPLSRRAGTMQAPDASSPSCARAISPRQGAARLVQDWIVIPLTPAKHQATCRLPCPLCAFRRDACQPYISGRHGRAPDYSPGRRAAAPAPCTRAVRCDLKPIMDRRAARVAACHNRRSAQLEGDSRLVQKDQFHAFHKSMEKMPPRVCRQTAMHARHGRTNPQHRESGWHDLRVAILSLRSTYPAVINRLRDN